MDPAIVTEQFPYPIAVVYAMIDNPNVTLPARREALSFTVYQLMRTLCLPLIGQYLTQDLPQSDVKPQGDVKRAQEKLNTAILGLRAPHFNDWITTLNTLRRRGGVIGLDFFPELNAAVDKVNGTKVPIPDAYRGNDAQMMPLFEAFRNLRNASAHSGVSLDTDCAEAIAVFHPWLDELLGTFAFLANYDLMTLAEPYDGFAGTGVVRILRGAQPPAPETIGLTDALADAFNASPTVMCAPSGRMQALFPLFHAHLQGEPLHYYDGHYISQNPLRRTIYYLGSHRRIPLDDSRQGDPLLPSGPTDAAHKLNAMLEARHIRLDVKREDLTPWLLYATANDFAARTVQDMTGIKYLPSCYLDRPSLSGPLWHFATTAETPYRAILYSGRAGSGKTALLCDLTQRLLNEQTAAPVVFFLRGDGILLDLPGPNLLLASVLHQMAIVPNAFGSFGEFFAHLARMREMDKQDDRLVVLIFDALNEAPRASQIFREALDMVAAARNYGWLRIVLSIRVEYLDIWQRRREAGEANPFYTIHSLFVLPSDDPARQYALEEPPAWIVPGFTEEQAEAVYKRYQKARLEGKGVPACKTPWNQINARTRNTLLTTPLYLDLWMNAFNDKEASTISGELELFDKYKADIKGRFDNFWPDMRVILKYMLERGLVDLEDGDVNEIRDAWDRTHSEDERRRLLSPIETACAAGVMQKRVTEEGGGYRIPFQRLREVLIYQYLIDTDKSKSKESLRQWLKFPPTDDLVAALSQIAEELWKSGDRSEDVVVFIENPALAHSQIGWRALERMLARVIGRGEAVGSILTTLSGAILPNPTTSEVLRRLMSELPMMELLAYIGVVVRWTQGDEPDINQVDSVDMRNRIRLCERMAELAISSDDSGKAVRWIREALDLVLKYYTAE